MKILDEKKSFFISKFLIFNNGKRPEIVRKMTLKMLLEGEFSTGFGILPQLLL